MRVPGSHIDVRAEKIPAAEKKANDRKKNADHAQRGEFAEFFGPTRLMEAAMASVLMVARQTSMGERSKPKT